MDHFALNGVVRRQKHGIIGRLRPAEPLPQRRVQRHLIRRAEEVNECLILPAYHHAMGISGMYKCIARCRGKWSLVDGNHGAGKRLGRSLAKCLIDVEDVQLDRLHAVEMGVFAMCLHLEITGSLHTARPSRVHRLLLFLHHQKPLDLPGAIGPREALLSPRRLRPKCLWAREIAPAPTIFIHTSMLAGACRRVFRASFSTLSSTKVFGGANASPAAKATFDAWHQAADSVMHGGVGVEPAMAMLIPHVHDECIFRPPTYYKPWVGRNETLTILGCVSEVFGPSFQYGRQWLSEDGLEWALEFTAEVGEKTIHGIDLVTLCPESCRIREFTVLARPPNAVSELKAAMMAKLPTITRRLATAKLKQTFGVS